MAPGLPWDFESAVEGHTPDEGKESCKCGSVKIRRAEPSARLKQISPSAGTVCRG